MTSGREDDSSAGWSGPLRVWRVLKWLVPVLALGYLWREGTFVPGRFQLGWSGAGRILLAMTLLAVGTSILAIRFHCLLAGLGAPSRLTAHFRLVFPGILIQQFAAEAGFDVMRLVAAQKMGGSGPTVFAALLVDRLLGLLALTATTLVGMAWFWADGWTGAVVLAACAVILAPFVLAFLGRTARKRKWRFPGAAFVASVGEALEAYRGRAWNLLPLFALSCVSHFGSLVALYLCGGLIAGGGPTLGETLVGGSMAYFTSAFPLPMAGLGVGETAFAGIVQAMRGGGDAGGYGAAFLLNRAIYIVLGAVSWLVVAISGKR